MSGIERPELIFSRYLCGNTTNVRKIEKVFGDDDVRFVYLVDTDRDEHVAIKATNNSFTTRERISGWRELIDLYHACGIYAPRILLDRNGALSSVYEEGDQTYTVYAEEKKKYQTADAFGIERDDPALFEDMVRACAKMARVSVKLPAWHTGWCIYDTFCVEDETDDTYMFANQFCKAMNRQMPRFIGQTQRIWDRFLSLYEQLRPAYQRLPKAFLQGDEGGDNVLVDADGAFVGMLDFNLAGTETILNYMFRNFCRVRINQDALSRLRDPAFLRQRDEEMRRRLAIVEKHYQFSAAEREAFPMYYQMVYPMECDLCQVFEKAIKQGDPDQTRIILDWIEAQQWREDMKL